jgi:hypothetical protein
VIGMSEDEIWIEDGALRIRVRDPFAFVLMSFDAEDSEVYQTIKETAEEQGFRCTRVDDQHFDENIVKQIYQQIEAADLIIADLSGEKPNVFYEIGYARARGKPIVLLNRDNDVPFDLAQYPHIRYRRDRLDDLRSKLGHYLLQAVKKGRYGGELPGIYFHIINKFSSKCLDVVQGSMDDGATLHQWLYHGEENQLWKLIPVGDGIFQIISVRSGKALCVIDDSDRSGAQVVQSTYTGKHTHKWVFKSGLDRTYTIQNCGSGKYLDLAQASRKDETLVVQSRGHSSDTQRWWLVTAAGLELVKQGS